MSDTTMAHASGCSKPAPWLDRFIKPGWVQLKCPECKYVANLPEATVTTPKVELKVAPPSGYRCRDHHSEVVTPKGRGCTLCPTRKTKPRKANQPSDYTEMEQHRP